MTKRHLPLLILWLLILAFTLYFSCYAIQRYETLHAYTADLSLIDQAMWNTLHGRFLEATWGDAQQPRLAEHFEPILIPLAALFWLWDDVRILLIAQSFALAIGALPVYWLALEQVGRWESGQVGKWAKEIPPAHRLPRSPALLLIFPLLYLLSPPLQAAAVADFHADPFVVAPFLFAFWYATQRRWGWMWFWAIIVMLVKENMPTLVVMLGVYLLANEWWSRKRRRRNSGELKGTQGNSGELRGIDNSSIVNRQSSIINGLSLIAVGTAWFFIATFGIVAPLAQEYFGSEGPVYLSNRFSTNPVEWLYLLREPARLSYLGGLIATTGGLALLAPQYLLLGLPIFIANTFSNFSGQFSGEQHYSAPLVAVLTIAAIYGAKNALRFTIYDFGFTIYDLRRSRSIVNRKSKIVNFLLQSIPYIALLIALLYQTRYGWTPLSRRAEIYPATAHTQMLPRFLDQIPANVPISASGAVHPHLAHRAVAYTFPSVQEAEYILVDVSDVPGVHPNDVRSQLDALLASGDWRLRDAGDGFILLQKSLGSGPQTLPDEFYAFARAPDQAGEPVSRACPELAEGWAGGLFSHPLTRSPAHLPDYPLDITFGDKLQLLGFDLLDDPFHQQTALRLYWQALQSDLPADLKLWPQFYDDDGRPLTNPLTQPAIETVWYPPSRWQAGEIVTSKTLPADLGDAFHLAVAVIHGDNPSEFNRRLPVAGAAHPHDQNSWATVASFRRDGWNLYALPPTPPLKALTPLDIAFEDGLELKGARLPSQAIPANEALTITLSWESAAPLPLDYTIFIHLLDAEGNTVAQVDAQPEWVFPLPTSRWQPGKPALTSHILSPPLPAGSYQVRVGLYDWRTLERLPLASGESAVVIGKAIVEP